MKEYYFYDKEFENSILYQDFISNNPGKGRLKIRSYAYREALPLEGLHIIVSTSFLNSKITFFDGYTDSSGMIDTLVLPAPIMNSDNLIIPSSISYEIRAEDKKYGMNQIFAVNLYDDVCVIQNIHFIPESGVE